MIQWFTIMENSLAPITATMHDLHKSGNCANTLKGGWWYAACFPTGAHLTGPHSDASQWNRLLWYLGGVSDIGCYKYYDNVEMKIRPKRCAHS